MTPKVSICVPAYQQPECLARLLRSIEAQRWRNFEVVITDDSDTDCLREIVLGTRWGFALRYARNPLRLGTPENWNRAVELAQGEFIKVLHHDDWFPDAECLSDFVQMLDADGGAAIGFVPSIDCDEQGSTQCVRRPTPAQLAALRNDPAVLFFGNLVGAPSATIYRRSAAQRYDPRLKWCVDLEFYIRMMRAHRFAYLDKPRIAVTAEAPFKVTNLCVNDRRLQVYEWTFMYAALARQSPFSRARWWFMRRLFRKYAVRSGADLAECGVDFPLPASLRMLLALRRLGVQ